MFGNIVGGVEMESWTNKLAKKIKGFENPNPIGSIIGEVVKPMPELTISVMDGQVILYPEQLYINTLLTSEYVRSFEIKDSTFELSGNKFTLTASPFVISDTTPSSPRPVTTIPEGQTSKIEVGGKATITGNFKLVDTLKKGDFVKVTPTVDEQTWFIDYVVKKVGV